MSLINDALKRAHQSQPNAAPSADGPALRPHFASSRSHGNDWLLPALIVIVLLLATMLLWAWFHSAPVTVRAKTAPETVAPTPVPAPAIASIPTPSSVPAKPPSVDSTAQSGTPAPATAAVSSVTNVPVAAPVPPAPPTYKLQSIFYRAKSPAAVINGKTLLIGDRVAGAHVTAIDKDSVTIVTPQGATKVLELP